MNGARSPGSVPVKSLKTSLGVIESIVSSNGATVTEIAEELDLAQSTVHDHLTTLHRLGYAIHEGDEYQISTRFLQLGEYSRQNMELYQESQSELVRLADRFGEFASLVIEEDGEGILLANEFGENVVALDVYSGIRMAIHTTASCKAILAHLPDERTEEIIELHGLSEITPNTITDSEELFAELEQIKERGYALGHEERVLGMRTVAAPILDKSEQPRGSIAVWGPTNRIEGTRFNEEIPQAVMESVNVVELQMNYG